MRNPLTASCGRTWTFTLFKVAIRCIRQILIVVAAAALFFIPSAHSATFEQGMEAYERSDYETAFEIPDDLALDGDARALAVAGTMWKQGLGTKIDLAEALRYFDAGAQRDNPRCMVALGRFLRDGIATADDTAGAALADIANNN